MFFELGCLVGSGLYLYGIPNIIYPSPHNIKGVAWLIGSIAIFIGLNQSLQVTLIAWHRTGAANFAKFFVPLFVILLAIFTAPNISAPYADSYGIIHWNISYPYNIYWFLSGIFITVMPAIFLFSAKPEGQKAVVKKTLFAVAFVLGGLGGWGNIIVKSANLLIVSYVLMFLGFFAISAMIFIDIFTNEA